MPEQLLARIIRACSNEGELVLDPFGGSGTTLAVAKKLGRAWIGFEMSKEYAARIHERLATVQVGDDIVGASNPLTSAPSTPAPRTEHDGTSRPGRQRKTRDVSQSQLRMFGT